MSDGAEYPKFVTCPDGLKVVVKSAAEEALWLNPPLPPHTPGSYGAIPTVDETAGSFVKKFKAEAGGTGA